MRRKDSIISEKEKRRIDRLSSNISSTNGGQTAAMLNSAKLFEVIKC